MLRQRRSLIIGGATLIAVIAAVYATIGNPLDPFDNRRFIPVAWKLAERGQERGAMSRDLLQRHLAAGMTEQEVVTLLGAPDDINRGDKHPADRLIADRFYVYSIGHDFLAGMDNAYLYVHLDKSDRVVKVEIYGF